jgi:hypothetical protein
LTGGVYGVSRGHGMKEKIRKIPIAGSIIRKLYRTWLYKLKPFPGSDNYWVRRYNSGGNSGAGSYNRLAEFKAGTINRFVQERSVTTIIEYGCCDGNQLRFAEYPSYLGFDVSPKAIALCRDIFRNDKTKNFKLVTEYKGETAELTLSLDVIYHLIEDEVYYFYMHRLFDSSQRFVIIYSSNYEAEQKFHEKHRQFTAWVETNKSHWNLIRHVPNRYPYSGNNEEGSRSDFYIYEKV